MGALSAGMFGFATAVFGSMLVRFFLARIESGSMQWRYAETLPRPRETIEVYEWIPAGLEPVSVIHVHVGLGPWRRTRTVIRKVSMWRAKKEYRSTASTSFDDWDVTWFEYYWSDTGEQLSTRMAARLEKLRRQHYDRTKRQEEARKLSEAALEKLLS